MSAKDHSEIYYIPDPSPWPITGMVSMLLSLLGLALTINGLAFGQVILVVGLLLFAYLLYGWFRDVIAESLNDCYNKQVDASFRMGMLWFIASEVCFFLAFFGALFYIRNIALPWLGGEGHLGLTKEILYNEFDMTWPSQGPGKLGGEFTAMGPWGIPAINTFILLSSGATVTWAHWGLKAENHRHLIAGLIATISLGLLFVSLQAYEYGHAYRELNLTLETGIYGSTFYMLTGFHGFHVTMGAIMLMAILSRSLKQHFSPQNHFAFEAVAWYWHFVDVVWLALFIFIYWL